MNIILIEPHELNNNKAILSDYRSKHVNKVLRATTGDSIRIGIVDGKMGTGIIEKITKKEVTLKVSTESPPPEKASIRLILALPRPIILKRVLAQATALGVNQIHLINANRVEKSYFNATLIKKENFRPFLINGLEQAIDTCLPKVTIHHRFKAFIEDYLPTNASKEQRLIAHPQEAGSPYSLPAISKDQLVTLAIGPEGGWVDYELDKFQETGFTNFNLGPRILRVDTAVPAIISQVDLLRKLPSP